MEQIGIIVKAGEELKKDESGMVFKMGVDKFTYTLFDQKLQVIAKENLGKRVRVTYNQSADGKYRNVESIQLTYEPSNDEAETRQPKRQWGKSPEEQESIEQQVAAKLIMEGWVAGKFNDGDRPVQGLLGWLFAKLGSYAPVQPLPKTSANEEAEDVETSKGEVPKQAPVEGEKVRLEMFKAQCKRYGWDVSIKKGAEFVKGWLVEHFLMGWQELTAEAQEEAIARMRKLADEKEGE